MTELEEVMKDKVKQLLFNEFKEGWEFKVDYAESNPNFDEQRNMNHYKITIKNKETKKRRSFIFSQGTGVKETDDDSVIFNLIGCFLSDLPYIDLEEFDGLGYGGQEAVKVYKAICEQHDKLNILGLVDWLENLTDEEKELLE